MKAPLLIAQIIALLACLVQVALASQSPAAPRMPLHVQMIPLKELPNKAHANFSPESTTISAPPKGTAALSTDPVEMQSPDAPTMVATSVPSASKQANAALAALIGVTIMMILIP